MCRNIKLLFNFAPPATTEEMRSAALQYVRKVSGMNAPSQANKEAFDRAVKEIAAITERLLIADLDTSAAPRDRDVERERAKERGRQRDAQMRKRLGVTEPRSDS